MFEYLISPGVAKAGTTLLYDLLQKHPQIRRGQVKELHYFDYAENPVKAEYDEKFLPGQGLKMDIIAYDLYPNPSLGVSYVGLEELFERADVISLHCPLTKETKYMIDKKAIKKMKDGVILINTSRGSLIQTNDLIEALEQGKFAGVGLDVFEEEEEFFFEDYSDKIIKKDAIIKLTSYPNVILTSHQGFFTREAMKQIAEVTLKNAMDLEQNRRTETGLYANEIRE